jgi:hypothetical protein
MDSAASYSYSSMSGYYGATAALDIIAKNSEESLPLSPELLGKMIPYYVLFFLISSSIIVCTSSSESLSEEVS